ncbi:hypothetical protein BT96DRAFT_996000 [Gymnopus androsaceus JB14]|uniref:DUF6589 domain-containing protein n=1 Tax=Gymnopus androsaceus JB14 TaxID=1447944 RepID=A0A6A4HI24_9AGAR|nr:hypothetical protein BT96DRAFT_996000 [Gymnopus androsaceus JB14]
MKRLLHEHIVQDCGKEITIEENDNIVNDPELKISLKDVTIGSIRSLLTPATIGSCYKQHAPLTWGFLNTFSASPNHYQKRKEWLERQQQQTDEDMYMADSASTTSDSDNEDGSNLNFSAELSNKISKWSPIIVVIAVISMLAFAKNQRTNALPLILGLFFDINGTSARVLMMLSNIGLCILWQTVERLKERISEDAIALAIDLASSGQLLGIIFDNINLYRAKFFQRLTNQNSMIHATNTVLIGIDEEGINVEAAKDLEAKLKLRGERRKAMFNNILPTTEDNEHMQKSFRNLIAELLVRYTPGSGKWTSQKEMLDKFQSEMPQDRPLPPKKTMTRLLGVFDINEGSKKGIIKMLAAIPKRLQQTFAAWSARVQFILGDWLTINNIRAACHERDDNINPMEQLEYGEEMSQLFHFALNATHMIMCTHFGNAMTDPTSLAAHKGLLSRTWDTAKPNYAAVKSLIRHSLIARLLHIVMVKKGWKKWSQLLEWQPMLEEVMQLAEIVQSELTTATAAESAKSKKDDYMAHDILFIQDTLIFLEFEQAVSHADAGHVLRVLKYWCFAFRGARQHNYACECAEILFRWKYETTPAVHAHLNYWVKRVYVAKGNAVTVEYIIKKGSASVEAFREISHLVANFLVTLIHPDVPRRSSSRRIYKCW